MRVGIVGGGAAGLFAASFLKHGGADFVLLEKGPTCGRKLLLTGHGRCNITNRKPVSELKDGYHEASSFMKASLSSFTPDDAVRFIEDELKVPLKEEENNRIFPKSDKASDMRDALVSYIGSKNIKTSFDVVDVQIENTPDGRKFNVIARDKRQECVDKLIVATGGQSFPQTGSDGKAYDLIEDTLGHKITPLYPALTGIPVAQQDKKFTAKVSGVSVYAGAGLYLNNRKKNKTEGNVLFTHDGLSGPAITELARNISEYVVEEDGWIELDFTPGRDDKEIDDELLDEIRQRPDAKLTTIGKKYVPASLSEAIGERAGVTGILASSVTRDARKAFVNNLKHLHMTIVSQPKFETAYVTRGGVALDEVSRKTMESKLLKGLYIIGEVLDVDGISGGYNLQAAMSEAYVAVRSVLC